MVVMETAFKICFPLKYCLQNLLFEEDALWRTVPARLNIRRPRWKTSHLHKLAAAAAVASVAVAK